MRKMALIVIWVLASWNLAAQSKSAVKDSVVLKKDSLKVTAPSDSARLPSATMMLRRQPAQSQQVNVPAYQEPRSQYTYDKDGRITGGNTSFKVGKKKD
jgi:hypothetical protein